MMVVDRSMQEQAKVIFSVNFKTLSILIKIEFVGERTLYIQKKLALQCYILCCLLLSIQISKSVFYTRFV